MERKNGFERKMEKNMGHYVKKVVKVIAMIVFGGILFLLANYVLMQLWNWLMPDIFGLGTITFWQALGIFVLAKLLFGFGGGGKKGGGPRHKRRFNASNRCGTMRRDFKEWQHYDQFWKEEGQQAFKSYVERIKNENHDTE
jgi:hypothetical protein